jgi:polar amino acid transport system substrate-binding protein
LAALVLVALAGCGGVGLDRSAGRFEPAVPGTLTVATESVPAAGFWEGTAVEPTGGFEYELARRLQERFELDELEVVVVPFAEIIAGDIADADLALSLITPTSERDRVLDFSDPYLTAPPALLTAADLEVPDLETARDLQYVVETGTTLEPALSDSIDPIQATIVAPDRDAVLAALGDGSADAAIFDLPAAQALADQSDGEWHVAAKLGTDETVAAALPEDSSRNTEAVSSVIRALEADGTLDELSDRWLGGEITGGAPSVPLLRSSR